VEQRDGSGRQGNATYAVVCLLALLALAGAYSNHFDNGFHFDDSHVIVNNLSIRSLHDLPRFFSDPLTFTARPQNAVYRPLLTLSYALDYRLGGGLAPRQFHITQFALLVALGALLVALCKMLFDRAELRPSNRWTALAAATLFCMHTANTETVNYISSRSSLVATLGVVASFVLYLRWPSLRRWQLYLLPMLVAGLAKPLTVMFAPLLFVFVALFEKRRSFDELLRPAGLRPLAKTLLATAPALVAGAALYFFLRSMDAQTLEYADVDRWTYARTQPFVWLHYARLFLLPRGLTADTDWAHVERWLDVRLLVGGLFVAALVAAVVWLSGHARLRPVSFGLAWFGIALLPTSSFFPLSEVYNEHRLFFPFVGLSLAVCWAVASVLARRKRSRRAVTAGVLLALGVLTAHGVGTYQRNEVWRDEASLWHDVTVKSPRNGRGQMNYGLVLMRRGELEQALAHYERARELTPNYSVLEVNLGIVKSALGDPQAAEPHFKRALSLSPDYAAGHFYYARWLTEQGRGPQAMAHLRRALAISPGDVDANRMLLESYAAQGQRTALSAHSRRVLAIAPGDPVATAYAKGEVPYEIDGDDAVGYAREGYRRIGAKDWLGAAVCYRKSLELDPLAAGSWNDLGWALAQAGFFELALPCFERALELDPALERARDNLHWAEDGYSRGTAASGETP